MKQMLKLDTHSYEELFTYAISRWKQMSENTEVYKSDVSYTLLEMQCMLIDMLNYYMEFVDAQHTMKYSTLLQNEKENQIPIAIPFCMDLEEEAEIKIGMQFQIMDEHQQIVFENIHPYYLAPNSILAIYYQSESHTQRITETLQNESGKFQFPRNENAFIYIQIEKAFPLQKEIAIYIAMERNHHNINDFKILQMAQVQWEYYSIHGWEKVVFLNDETAGFLWNGEVLFEIGKEMQKVHLFEVVGYWIRISIKDSFYDKLPVIQNMWMNTMQMKLQSTLAKTFYFEKGEELCITHDIAHENCMVQKKVGIGLWEDCLFQKEQRRNGWYFSIFEQEQPSIRIICQRQRLEEIQLDSDVSGCSGQIIKVPKNCTYEISILNSKQQYRDYEAKNSVSKGKGGYGFYQSDIYLQFGNGRDFRIPEKCKHAILYKEFLQYYPNIMQFTKQQITKGEDATLVGRNALESVLHRKQERQKIPCLFQKQSIQEYIEKLPNISIELVRVHKRIPQGWCVYILAQESEVVVKEKYLSYIKTALQQVLPITMEVEIERIHNVYVDIYLNLYRGVDIQAIKKSIEASCKSYFKKTAMQEQGIKALEIQKKLGEMTDASALSNVTFKVKEKLMQEIPYKKNIQYLLHQCIFRTIT